MKLDLRSKKDFFSSCKRKHSPYLGFFYKKNSKEGLKVSIIVPKKIVKLATKRIKVKRKIYLAIESLSSSLLNRNINLALVVNKKAVELSTSEFTKIINSKLLDLR